MHANPKAAEDFARLVLVTARTLRALIAQPMRAETRTEQLRELDEALAPFDDDGCPHDDPDCEGRADQCRDACTRRDEAIHRLLERRNMLMNDFGYSAWRDGETVRVIESIDTALRARDYDTSMLQPPLDPPRPHPAPPLNPRDDNCELPKTPEPNNAR